MALSRAFTIRAVFFIHAIASGGIYARVAAIQHNLGVDEATLGLAFLGLPIGAILIFLFGSRLVEVFGTRRILMLTLPVLPVGAALLAAMPTAPLLFALFVVYGWVFSLPNMALNVEADRVEAATGTRVMNSCHGTWSVGFLLATLLGTLAESLHLSPIQHMGLLAIPVVPAAIWITRGLEESPPRPHTSTAVRRIALPTLAILLLVLFTLGPSLLEGALRNWSVIYMRDSFTAPSWVDTLTLPVFLTAHAIGRLSADRFVMRYGVVRVARTLTLLAFIGCSAVILAPNLWIALGGFLLIGFGVCTSYPLTTSAAARLGDRPSSQNVASLTFATQMLLLGAPAALGWVATNWGIRSTFTVLLPAILVSLWLARYLAPKRAVTPSA